MTRPGVTVVGAGIAGLAAARALAQAGADVVVVEANERAGGKLETIELDGVPVDTGPDSFLARVPHAVALCKELGLGDELVSPAASTAGLWIGGRLQPLPEGLVLGVPASLSSLTRSSILSPVGVARAALEPLLPRTRWTDDIGVGDLVRRRFGRQVHERLVDPLLGGINAGRSEELSIKVGAAQLAGVAERSRSLLLGLRAQRAATASAAVPGPPAPVFHSLRGGVATLVEALVADLKERGVVIKLGAAVDRLSDLDTERVVVAVPASAAASLLGERSPAVATLASGIGTSSVVLTTFVYDEADFCPPSGWSGFLVPRIEGRLMTACSYGSNKWPHWAADGRTVLRVSAGRVGDDRAMAMDDSALVDALRRELTECLGVTAEPVLTRVRRWDEGFPQLRPGHLRLMSQVREALAVDAPSIAVAGAWTGGVGIPTCIASGQAAAAAVLA